MNIWLTADTHFGHKNIIKYCERPFKTVEEMDTTLIKNWNKLVDEQDLVYHLGDFSMSKRSGDIKRYREKLSGKIFLIKGNHDRLRREDYELFEGVENIKTIRYNEYKIVLCHYAMRVWDGSFHGSLHFFGHSHSCLEQHGRSCDVGVDANNFAPMAIEEGILKVNQYPVV